MTSLPTAAFASADLDITTIEKGAVYHRIFLSHHPDPLGFGKTASRFSDPRRRVEANRFAVLYLGSSLKVCFLEAVLRDQRDGHVGAFPLSEATLANRAVAAITPTRPLRLVDLREDGAVRMGIPSDVVRATRQSPARAWSVAIHDHPAGVDGIVYPSRLNGEHNLALYDRAVPALRHRATVTLMRARGLVATLDDLRVALV